MTNRSGASTTAAADATDPPVATVAGRPIRLHEVEVREAALRRGPRARHLPPTGSVAAAGARRWIVRELVTEALVRQALDERGLPDVGALVDAVADGPEPTEADIADYYERNAARFRSEERRVVRLARATAGVEPDLTAASEAEVRRGELVGPFEDAIFAAGPGAVVGPFVVDGRSWLARLEGVFPAGRVPLSDVRREIETELRAVARSRRFDEWLERRRTTLVHLEPGFEHPGDPTGRAPTHRH
ncbi:MAG TPA: peptidylprolyl isomerase [Candidatus Limnocylindrales bacterium]|nr:peptidylprolyl isomerase [Candidatus Limnocylindrales bacterium]